jgi:integrase
VRKHFSLPGFRHDQDRGVVHLEVCLPGTGGKNRRRRTVEVPDKDAAVDAWKKFREEVGLRGGKATRWTLASYVREYRTALVARVSPGTVRNLNYQLDVLVRFLGPKRLETISLSAARDFAAEAAESGLGAPTVRALLSQLRRVLHDAVDRQELAHYPIRGKLPMGREEQLRLELSDEERARILAAFDDEAGFRASIGSQRVVRLEEGRRVGCLRVPGGEAAGVLFSYFRASRPVFVIALETGLSRGDLLALRWADVAESPIRIRRQKTGVESVIPISRACAAALQELRGRPLVDRTWIFLGPYGKRLQVDTLNHYWWQAKRLAGITRRCRFHDLRHTFGCRMVSAGVPLPIVAKAMGHKSIRMTERYARPSEASMEAIRAALDGEKPRSDRGANGGRG